MSRMFEEMIWALLFKSSSLSGLVLMPQSHELRPRKVRQSTDEVLSVLGTFVSIWFLTSVVVVDAGVFSSAYAGMTGAATHIIIARKTKHFLKKFCIVKSIFNLVL